MSTNNTYPKSLGHLRRCLIHHLRFFSSRSYDDMVVICGTVEYQTEYGKYRCHHCNNLNIKKTRNKVRKIKK